MQSQQTIIKTPVHVKVAYDDEFRRFLLSPITFDNLHSTLKTLFSIESEITIKFQDDENDWVLVTTDQELVYATELSGSPLRLQVKLDTSQPRKAAGPFTATERGRGRGCRGRKWGDGCRGLKSSPEERLQMRSSRITERIAMLESKLSSDKLTSERERVLRWKLAKFQEKLAAIKTALGQFSEAQQPQATTVPTTEVVASTDDVPQVEKPSQWRGGRCGRGGRGGCRRAMMENGSDQPVWKGRGRIAPEIIANFRQCKANLRAARESGNAEEIRACREALQAARAAKMAARNALDAQASVDEQKA